MVRRSIQYTRSSQTALGAKLQMPLTVFRPVHTCGRHATKLRHTCKQLMCSTYTRPAKSKTGKQSRSYRPAGRQKQLYSALQKLFINSSPSVSVQMVQQHRLPAQKPTASLCRPKKRSLNSRRTSYAAVQLYFNWKCQQKPKQLEHAQRPVG
jgi:hypothetical protein